MTIPKGADSFLDNHMLFSACTRDDQRLPRFRVSSQRARHDFHLSNLVCMNRNNSSLFCVTRLKVSVMLACTNRWITRIHLRRSLSSRQKRKLLSRQKRRSAGADTLLMCTASYAHIPPRFVVSCGRCLARHALSLSRSLLSLYICFSTRMRTNFFAREHLVCMYASFPK
jgi:hypothetical protein